MSLWILALAGGLAAAGVAAWVATDWTVAMLFLWPAVALPVVEKTVGVMRLVRYDPSRGRPRKERVGQYALVIGASMLVSAAFATWALTTDDALTAYGPLYLLLTAYTAWAVVHVRSRVSRPRP